MGEKVLHPIAPMPAGEGPLSSSMKSAVEERPVALVEECHGGASFKERPLAGSPHLVMNAP
jgi:hypothetical protein